MAHTVREVREDGLQAGPTLFKKPAYAGVVKEVHRVLNVLRIRPEQAPAVGSNTSELNLVATSSGNCMKRCIAAFPMAKQKELRSIFSGEAPVARL
eukprot:CAMPEP_0194530268 /NCGR_PEP_ID=MMETSP0253-20130528/67168_1 /TAXON_ID=2966 /ORGANISM="Noctiluca scintillans" /LENGTH=95 /DNA_ID=CAMNT_0039375481 /DNA_START=372 /DNA_END=660 /DNA_ORIENTATION=+